LGALYAITIIIYELYKNKLSKKFIIDQFKKFFFFLIPTAVLALFMYIDGNLFDFINFAFGGLFDFGKNNALLPESGYHPDEDHKLLLLARFHAVHYPDIT